MNLKGKQETGKKQQKISKETAKKNPPQSAVFALYDALAAVGYVVNLKPLAGCNMHVIEAAA